MRMLLGLGGATIAAALALAACGSSGGGGAAGDAAPAAAGSSAAAGGAGTPGSTGAASAAAGSTTAASATATSTAAVAAAKGKGVNVCEVLSKQRAGQIAGKSFASTKSRAYAGVLSSCEYTGGYNLLQVSVSYEYGQHLFDGDIQALKAVGHPPNRVSGVGDAAYNEPDPKGNAGAVGAADSASYGAVFGDTYIKVGGMYVTAAQGRQLVELIHAAM